MPLVSPFTLPSRLRQINKKLQSRVQDSVVMPKRKGRDDSITDQLDEIEGLESAHDVQHASKKARTNTTHCHSPASTPASSATSIATIQSYMLEEGPSSSIHVKDLIIHKPRGQKNDLYLKLDLTSSTLSIAPGLNSSFDTAGEVESSGSIQAHADVLPSFTFSKSRDEDKCGFLKLPAELRDIVYGDVFVSKNRRWVDLSILEGNDLSAAFLGTCRQIYNEGRIWLYLENRFYLGRSWRSHGDVVKSKSACLSYETTHTFIKNIGAANLGFIREIHLHLNDEVQTGPSQSSPEQRRYIHDDDLKGIIQILAKKTQLEKVTIVIDGKSTPSDTLLHRELKYFKGERAYEARSLKLLSSKCCHALRPNISILLIQTNLNHQILTRLHRPSFVDRC